MADASHDWQRYLQRIEAAESNEEVDAVEHELLGRKQGALTLAMQEIKNVPSEKRKEFASELNVWKQRLTEALERRKQELLLPSDDTLKTDDALDVSLNVPGSERGHLHPIPEFIRSIEEVFGRMGFQTYGGPEIESEEYNFNKLNIPESHPARDGQDTFWIKGRADTVLRTHTSPVQIRFMENKKPPFRAVFPGKVYRKDSDATHSPMFHQFEGLMIDKNISIANLKAVLVEGLQELIGRKVEFRFRTGYFPFTEPSMEMDMMWQGDPEDSREGKWLEMGGCGMVHPNVLRNVGIDPDEWQGFAFGFGVERPLMIKHQIPDLRSFYHGDLRFLRQF